MGVLGPRRVPDKGAGEGGTLDRNGADGPRPEPRRVETSHRKEGRNRNSDSVHRGPGWVVEHEYVAQLGTDRDPPPIGGNTPALPDVQSPSTTGREEDGGPSQDPSTGTTCP